MVSFHKVGAVTEGLYQMDSLDLFQTIHLRLVDPCGYGIILCGVTLYLSSSFVPVYIPLFSLCPGPMFGPGGSVEAGCGNMDLILTDRQLDPQHPKWGEGLT